METWNPRISVIVPVYKVEKYLDKCVKSLLRQTYENMNIILVDDGSPDGCPAMCDRYAAAHENIIALHKQNGGLGDARNYGVRHTECDWVVFVDSDDYVEPQYVETLVRLQNLFHAQMVITRIRRENENGSGKPTYRSFQEFLADKNTALFQVYSGNMVGWQAVGKLLPRNVLLKHPFPDGYYEDCACMYKIIEEFDRIAIGNYENNYHYIQREGSILKADLNAKHYRIFEIAEEFESFIRTYHRDMEILIPIFYKRAVIQLLNLQRMPWKTYREIFLKYRPKFREHAGRIIKDDRLSHKDKLSFLLLCSTPEVFYIQRKILLMIR